MKQIILASLMLGASAFWGSDVSAANCKKDVCFEDRSELSRKGKNRWNWNLFVAPDSPRLGAIKCVEYSLHYTFPDPVRQVCRQGNRKQPFAVSSNGWGSFTVKIRVQYHNSGEQKFTHNLKLGKN